MDHGRIGRVGRNRGAGSCKAGHGVAVWAIGHGRAGQRLASGTEQRHTEPGKAGKDPGRVTKDRSVLGKIGQNLTGPGMVSRTGQGWCRWEGQC